MAGSNDLRKKLYLPILALALSTLFLLHPSSGHSYELLIGTGDTDSFSYFAGKTLCRSINRADNNLTCRPVPSGDYTDNLTNLLSGSLDLALVNSKIIYDAFNRAGYFQFITLEYDQLRLLMPLYRTPISLVVRRDAKITSLAALAGKRVNGGTPYGLEDIVFRGIMAAQGWQPESFSTFQNLSAVNAQDFIALHGGSIQAMLHIGMHPDPKLAQSLGKKRSTELIGISGDAIRKLIDANAGFSSQIIPADTYTGLSRDINTLALETLIIASADTDDATVNQVLASIHAARKQLQYAHPALLQVRTDIESLNESYLHPHPEAILFFQTNR